MRGSLRYRAGAWRLAVKIAGKQRTRTVHAPNTREGRTAAERELRRFVDELEVTPLADGITFADWYHRWVTMRAPTLAPATRSANATFATRYVLPAFGPRPLSAITTEDIQITYAHLRSTPGAAGRPLGAASVQRIHNMIHSVFEGAVKAGRILRNPASAVELEHLPDPDPRPPSTSEVVRLLDHAARHPMLHAYVRLSATAGPRRGMTCALKWADIEGATVTFRRAWSKGPEGWVPVEHTKSGAVVRVELAPTTVEVLDVWREVTYAQHADCGVDPEWVFTRQPGVPMLPSTMTSRFARLRAEAGAEHVQLRSLRHFMATEMLAGGEDLFVVSRRLGHRNVQVTSRYYAQFRSDHDRAAATRLDDTLDTRPIDS